MYVQETKTTNYMSFFLSCFLDFSDQYNDVNNSAGHSLGPCSWWQNITNNAFIVQILYFWVFVRKLQGTKTILLWPQKQGTLLWLCFHAPPRHVTSNYSLQLAFVYSPVSKIMVLLTAASLHVQLPHVTIHLTCVTLLTLRCSD